MKLTDLLSPEQWLQFDMDFYDRSGMNAYAFDSGGDRIAGHKKWANQLCPVIKANPKGRVTSICGLSHQAMANRAKSEKRTIIDECEAGLLKICVPVFHGDEFVGIIGGCGLLAEDGELGEEMIELVTGMSPELIQQLGSNIPRVTQEDVESHARFLEQRAQELLERAVKGKEKTELKTFRNLIEEVQQKGLCFQCGGCVTFCTAINYGALELGEGGLPRYRDIDKCIECGICYMICPSVGVLDEETKKKVGWTEPIGKVIETTVARIQNPEIRSQATDGGVVTGILLNLFDKGHIDGAIVTRQTGPFNREPWLASTREQIIEAAGSHFSISPGMTLYSEYTTFSPSIKALRPLIKEGLKRVAFVGTPCQVQTLRKMETLGVVPTDSIYCILGLFCSGTFLFHKSRMAKLEKLGGFKWEDVQKVNLRSELIIHLKNGEVKTLDIDDVDFLKRPACRYCTDYTAEFADLSFGGIGSSEGWTTVISRTPLGNEILGNAKASILEEYRFEDDPKFSSKALSTVKEHAGRKRERAKATKEELRKSAD